MSDDGFGQDFPGAPQQVDFWSLEIPPNKTVEAKLSELPGLMEIAHVTTVALGEAAKPGRHVVKVIPMDLDRTRKPEVSIGTLELGRTDQFSVDFGFSSSMAFRHTGKSSVYLSGYMTRSYEVYGSESDDEYESASESESEDEEAPAAVPLLQNGKKVVPASKGAAAPAANGPAAAGGVDSSSEEDESEEEEGESEEEGEDEDMMGDEYDRRLGAKSFGAAAAAAGDSDSSSGGEEEEGEGESESDDDPLDIDSDDLVAGIEYADVEAEEDGEDESSDEGEEDEGEDEDEEEDESSDEEQQPQQQQQQQQQQQPAAKGKRSAPPMTPQPQQQQAAKKQKGAEGRPVSASAPAKGPVAKTAAAGGDAAAAAYVSALVAELKKSSGSSLPLSTLASKVKKPAEVSAKFKSFLVQHADTFTLSGDTVGLVKK